MARDIYMQEGQLPARLTARLRPPSAPLPVVTRRILLAFVTFAVGLGFTYLTNEWGLGRFAPLPALIGAGLVLGAVVAVLLNRALTVPDQVPPLLLLDRERFVLPLGHLSEQTEEVPLSEVRSLEVIVRGRSPRLEIGTRGGVYVYPLDAFEPRDAAINMVRAAVIAIGDLPEGRKQIAEMHEYELITRSFVRRRPVATQVLLALIFAGFLLQHLVGAFDGSLLEQQVAMLRLGANASVLVADGEWWRLFAANFLHGGWVHIGLNALALRSLGGVLERLVDTPRYIIIYLASAVAGTLASAWAAQGPFSVGASTAIFGLLGGFAVMSLRFGHQLPAGIHQSRRWWLFILGVNGALPLALPMIDTAAHVGGFIAGSVVTWLAYPSVDRYRLDVPPTLGLRLGAALLVALFAVAGVSAARYGVPAPRDPLGLVTRVFGVDESPTAHNLYAWMVVTSSPTPSRAGLVEARDRAAKVVEEFPESGYIDTLATAEYRLGDRRRAARLERKAILRYAEEISDRVVPPLAGEDIFWSQLARFVRGPSGDAPLLVDGSTVAAAAVSIGFEPGVVVVDRQAGLPLVVFAQVTGPNGPRGVLRIGLEASTPSPASLPWTPELAGALAGQADLHAFWVDTSTAGPAPAEVGVAFRPHDATVDDLP